MRFLTIAAVLLVACGDSDSPVATDTDPDAADTANTSDADTSAPPRQCRSWSAERIPLFGDLHVHTALSLDANLQGTRLTPADAYRFAKGETVGLQPYRPDGTPLRTLTLSRPLDFAAVTDHAEFLGTVNVCTTPGTPGYDDEDCRLYRDNPDRAFILINAFVAAAQSSVTYPDVCGEDGALCRLPAQRAWGEIREAAAAAHDPTDTCAFTSLVGYEWSGAPGTANLHRNVIFATDAVPELPTSYFEEPYPDGLWTRLEQECAAIDGCDVLAIPHNSNLSSGLMFEAKKRDGSPIDRAFADQQARMEPLVEIMQHKGDSECLPGAPTSDELCGFEKIPYDSLGAAGLGLETAPRPQDFARDAMLRGLSIFETIGTNPFKYGVIASTDTHLGTPGATAETTYPGHGGAGPGARDTLPAGLVDQVAFNPGGLVGVWAEENSRPAIFSALRRKETWGTSGPRIAVRFFGGDVDASLCDDPELVAKAYATSVPMGSDLRPRSTPPRFLVVAQRDPGTAEDPTAPLARIQIIKGYIAADNTLKTKIFEVSGDASAPAPLDCTPAAGFDRLCGVVEDTDFDETRPAFWYARAVERPTCRWSTRACLAANIDCTAAFDPAFAGCCDTRYPKHIQERAWTSPIWWEPAR
jgi:hypothetical protein